MCNTGNLYWYKGHLLINEIGEGIHVIDDTDPANPLPVAFIEVPGNVNMAVKDDILYADLFIDLVAIDISDISKAHIIGRTQDVFSNWYPLIEGQGYIIDYVPTEQTIEIDCRDGRWGRQWFAIDMAIFATASFDVSSSLAEVGGNTGVAGSMARFSMAKEHLYAIDEWQLRVFNLDNTDPMLVNTVQVEWGIETLFSQGDYLFIGANAGMFIYDNSNPSSPAYVSEFRHARSCDPVVVQGNIAYVTLRSGNECQGFTNQLDVIDIEDIRNPRLIRSYSMDNPHGLSVIDSTLYLCEGQFGLKVYDITDVNAIQQSRLDHKSDFHCFDVIALPGTTLVMVVGEDGLYQFDSADRTNLADLSKIETVCN